jgi:hypothetical protein
MRALVALTLLFGIVQVPTPAAETPRIKVATEQVAASELATAGLSVAEVVSRHVEARGGAERWRALESLRLRGTYAAFSQRADFTLIGGRGDLYRLDFTLLESPATRARDEQGTWALHKLLQPEPERITEGPYRVQMERESLFGLALLDHAEKGIEVQLAGEGEVDGIPTVNLEVTLPSGEGETWMLDAESFLEVAIDSTVVDHTQSAEPVSQRTFFDDYRDVEGLVIPHQVDFEFGHRLESMTVGQVEIDPKLAEGSFSPPAASPAAPPAE